MYSEFRSFFSRYRSVSLDLLVCCYASLLCTIFGREANPEEKIKPAPAWAVYAMLVVWYGAALVLNGTFRSALVQDLGARGAKEAMASTARMEMGL